MHTAPYIGLRPYTRDDSALFFGRDGDTQIVLDKILANRLTLLFAASGVGKSSLLQARVMLKLAGRAAYFNNWVGEPLAELKQAVADALRQDGVLPAAHEAALDLDLREFLRRYTLFCAEPLVLILDQFEEFFNYQRFKPEFAAFIAQFAEAAQDRGLNAQFVLSMREDFALELNAFKPLLPGILDNFYRLEKLSRETAWDALVKPLQGFDFKYEYWTLKKF
jgi:hypothetical protein